MSLTLHFSKQMKSAEGEMALFVYTVSGSREELEQYKNIQTAQGVYRESEDKLPLYVSSKELTNGIVLVMFSVATTEELLGVKVHLDIDDESDMPGLGEYIPDTSS